MIETIRKYPPGTNFIVYKKRVRNGWALKHIRAQQDIFFPGDIHNLSTGSADDYPEESVI